MSRDCPKGGSGGGGGGGSRACHKVKAQCFALKLVLIFNKFSVFIFLSVEKKAICRENAHLEVEVVEPAAAVDASKYEDH